MNQATGYLTTTIELEIPFFDVDAMEVVWHGHYVKYFELARCALLEKLNYNYDEMKQSGYTWPVVDLRIKYVKPVRFKQTIIVEATLVEFEHRLKIQYLIVDQATGDKLTKAYSVQIAVDLANGETCFVAPKVLVDKINSHMQDQKKP